MLIYANVFWSMGYPPNFLVIYSVTEREVLVN